MSEKYEILMTQAEYDLLVEKVGKKIIDDLINKTIKSLELTDNPMELLFISAFLIGKIVDISYMGMTRMKTNPQDNEVNKKLEATMGLLLESFITANLMLKELRKELKKQTKGITFN